MLGRHDARAEERATDYFNELLPNVGIYRKKIELCYRRHYRTNLHGRIRKQETELRSVLAGARAASDQYEHLEAQLRNVAKAYDDYAAMLAVFKDLQNTLAINAANLTELLDRFSLPQDGLPNIWRAKGRRAIDQLNADERYFEARTREAELTLRVLEARVEIERVKQEDRENKLSEKRNLTLTYLMLWIGFLSLVLTLASDEVKLFDPADGPAVPMLERLGFLNRDVPKGPQGMGEPRFRIPRLFTRCWDAE
jgi:hypothetical protein